MLLLLMMQLTVSLLLTVNHMTLTPPSLTVHSTLWLVTIVTPAIALTSLGNPLDISILKDAQGKNVTSISKKVSITLGWVENGYKDEDDGVELHGISVGVTI